MKTLCGLTVALLCLLLPGVARSAPACVPVPSGLVAWWQGEGNPTDVFVTNSIRPINLVFTNGLVGQAFSFDGSSSWATASASASLDLGAGPGLTIEAWISPADVSGFYPLVGWKDFWGNPGLQFGIGVTGNGPGSLAASLIPSERNTYAISSEPGLIVPGRWQHVAITYDKESGIARLYVNGFLVASRALGSVSAATSFDGASYSGYDMFLGALPYTAFYPGQMDEVALYNRALSPAEIQAVYNAGSAGKCPVPPAFVRQPSHAVQILGHGVTFESQALGSFPLAYEWYFNGVAINSATTNSLTLANVQSNNVGSYSVAVSNSVGIIISSNATLSVVPPRCAAPFANPVSWWPGDGNGIDVIGGDNAILSGVTFLNGKVGQAFNFDGVSSYVFLPASSRPQTAPAGGITFECWIKPAYLTDSRPLASWGDADHGTAVAVIMNGDRLSVSLPQFPSATILSSAPGVLQAGIFQHVAFTYDYNSSLGVLYCNGRVVASQFFGSWPVDTSSDMWLGIMPGDTSRYAGLMDEVAIYNRVLNAAEIQTIYSAGSEDKCSLAVASLSTTQHDGQSVAQARNLTGSLSSPAGNAKSMLVSSCVPSADGMVAWWQGEDNALDVMGYSGGNCLGDVTFGAGQVGQTFTFDGNGSGVNVGSGTNLHLQNFTIEGWIRRASVSTVSFQGNGNGHIFSVGSIGGFAFVLDSSGHLRLLQLGDWGVTAFPSLTDTNWHHVAATLWQGSVVLYLDGVASSPYAYSRTFTFDSPAVIGAWVHDATVVDNSFYGSIDELAVYNRALSASEVQAIYNAGGLGRCPVLPSVILQPASQTASLGNDAVFSVIAKGTTLRCQWLYNGGAIPGATNLILTIPDVYASDAGSYSVLVTNSVGSVPSSDAVLTVVQPLCVVPPEGIVGWWRAEGNAIDFFNTNNATPNGSLAFSPGKVNQAFAFDGSSAFLQVPASASLDVSQGSGFTLEAWVKPADTVQPYPVADWNDGWGDYGADLWINYAGKGAISATFCDANTWEYHTISSPPGVLNAERFQHIALTYDQPTGIAALYYNGYPVATQNLGSFTVATSGYDFFIGVWPYGYWSESAGSLATTASMGSTGTNSVSSQDVANPRNRASLLASMNDSYDGSYYSGQMDEVSLYSRCLSANQIQTIYNASLAGKCLLLPVVQITPASQVVAEGGSATFSATATGMGPLTYQWSLNGTNITGATASSYTLPNLSPSASGGYSVLVSNPGGTVESMQALLTVVPRAWLIEYFGSNYPTDPNAALDADPNHDGVPNWQEYLMGRNPVATSTVADTGNVIGLQRYTPLH